MTTTPETGGPAFPLDSSDGARGHQSGPNSWQFPGLSIRDHFAGLALAAMIGNTDKDGCTRGAAGVPILAKFAYEYADAMLAERVRAAAAIGEAGA